MAFVTFFGKTLIVAAIIFQAWLLYQDKREGDEFHKNLTDAIANCSCLNSVRPYLEQYLRLAVVGLLASSVLLIITRCWVFKLFPLLGLSVLLWIEHHAVFRTVPTIALLDNSPLWHSLGVIGAIIYLMGAECGTCKKPAPAAETARAEPSSKSEPKTKPKRH